MANKFKETNGVFRKKQQMVAIPNCAFKELSLEALGFYGCILTRVQCENANFKDKNDLIEKALTWGPDTRETLETALNELIEKQYVIVDENELCVTYGPYEKDGEK